MSSSTGPGPASAGESPPKSDSGHDVHLQGDIHHCVGAVLDNALTQPYARRMRPKSIGRSRKRGCLEVAVASDFGPTRLGRWPVHAITHSAGDKPARGKRRDGLGASGTRAYLQ